MVQANDLVKVTKGKRDGSKACASVLLTLLPMSEFVLIILCCTLIPFSSGSPASQQQHESMAWSTQPSCTTLQRWVVLDLGALQLFMAFIHSNSLFFFFPLYTVQRSAQSSCYQRTSHHRTSIISFTCETGTGSETGGLPCSAGWWQRASWRPLPCGDAAVKRLATVVDQIGCLGYWNTHLQNSQLLHLG